MLADFFNQLLLKNGPTGRTPKQGGAAGGGAGGATPQSSGATGTFSFKSVIR